MRRGVTLLEVLFAIIVVSVGLLGAIALFTVANATKRKAQIADATAAAGQAAISAFSAEGMHERTRWLYWDAANNQTAFMPLAMNDPPTQAAPNPFYGRAFCIDARGFEQNRLADIRDGQNNSALWSWFPAVPETNPTPNAATNGSRMIRLTLHNGNPALPLDAAQRMSFIQADKIFRVEDELVYERPTDNALPAVSLYTQSGGAAGRRQEEGRLTWMATLVPRSAPAKEVRLESTPTGYVERQLRVVSNEYVLSVAVFYNRTPDTEVPNAGDKPWNEWTAKVLAGDFHANGVGGGEVTITTNNPAQDATFNDPKYLDITRGSWIMLARTIPTAATPIQHWQWYRVSDTEENARQAGTRWVRDVTLIGGDWPADMVAGDGIPEECDVVIVPDVAHVYERTVTLGP